MEIFNNSERTGYEEIVSYGPKWWTEYREMDASYRYSGWTLDLMAYHLERVVKNQFPAHADERTIAILEILLHIENDVELSLEERRRIVEAYYTGYGHLSKSVIQQMIKAYVGCESDIFWDGIVFAIYILGENGSQFFNDKILKFISRRMPAHIAYSVSAEEKTEQIWTIGLVHMIVPRMIIQCEELNYYHLNQHVGISHVTVPNIILM